LYSFFGIVDRMIQPVFIKTPYSSLSPSLKKECNRVWRAAFGYSWFSSLAVLHSSDWVCICLDESSQNVLACCFICKESKRGEYYIYNVCSDPKFKGYGFGRSLLKHVLYEKKFLNKPASLDLSGESSSVPSAREQSSPFDLSRKTHLLRQALSLAEARPSCSLSVHLANIGKATVPFVEQRIKLYSGLGFGIKEVLVENNTIIIEMSTNNDPTQNSAWFQHIRESLIF